MADFGIALKARLAAYAPLTTLTGAGKLHWGKVPQGTTLPYIRLQTISDPLDEHLKGYTGRQRPRVQADCFASSWGVARAMATAIRDAVAIPATVSGVKFNRAKAEGPRDLGEDVEGIGFVHRASIDLLVEHRLA